MSPLKQLGKIAKDLSKPEIEELANNDISEITKSGKYDLLKTFIELKKYSIYINKLIAELKEPALEKAQEIGEKKFKVSNAKVWITTRVSFDYSNDKIWQKLKSNTDDVKAKLTEHQEILRQLETEISQVVDEETGEITELIQPIKKEESGLMIRI